MKDPYKTSGAELLASSTRKLVAIQYVRPLALDVLRNWIKHRWSLQGFGMLRTYVTRELRLHVWDSRFAVPNVTAIHDHPWNFESVVIAGRLVNTRYRVHPCTQTAEAIAAFRIRSPFIKAQIVCGTDGGNSPKTMMARSSRVWLESIEPETYGPGDTYQQQADEVHHSSYDDGTVTLVSREFLPDTEHAHVFYKADDDAAGWVSAEPREATVDEVSAIVAHALSKL